MDGENSTIPMEGIENSLPIAIDDVSLPVEKDNDISSVLQETEANPTESVCLKANLEKDGENRTIPMEGIKNSLVPVDDVSLPVEKDNELSSVLQEKQANSIESVCIKANFEKDCISNKRLFESLLAMYEQNAVPNSNNFVCRLCNKETKKNEGIVLKECFHMFCRPCIKGVILLSGEMDIKCPYTQENDSCPSILMENEIQGVLCEGEYNDRLQRLLDIAEKSTEFSYHCQKPNCIGWCIIEGGLTMFDCPVCLSKNCIICKSIHSGFKCPVKPGTVLKKADAAEGYTKPVIANDEEDISKALVFENYLYVHDQKLVPYNGPFNCPICLENYESNKGVILKECLHVFCRDCITNTVKFSTEVDVRCPFRNNDYVCTSFLLENEIQEVLNVQEYNERLKKSLSLAEARSKFSYHCKTPNCTGWWLIEGDNQALFECPVCKSMNCFKCKTVHAGQICPKIKNESDVIRSEAMINGLITERRAMYCPMCTAIVQKISGCNHMSCGMCKHQFNWTGL